jgi:hypothetical protein
MMRGLKERSPWWLWTFKEWLIMRNRSRGI